MGNYTLSSGATVQIIDVNFTLHDRVNNYYAAIMKQVDSNGEPVIVRCDLNDCLYLLDQHQIRFESR